MSDDRWEEARDAGREAMEKTLESGFDLLEVSQDLYEGYK